MPQDPLASLPDPDPDGMPDIRHGVMVVRRGDSMSYPREIIHFVGQHGPVSRLQLERYIEELRDDPDFGFGAHLGKELLMLQATAPVVQFYRGVMGQPALPGVKAWKGAT